jgi:hypothetical protein
MFRSIIQNIVVGSVTIGIVKSTTAPRRWQMPKSFSAFIHLSATIPKRAGINKEAIPMVEKSAPKAEPVHTLVLVEGSINGYNFGNV